MAELLGATSAWSSSAAATTASGADAGPAPTTAGGRIVVVTHFLPLTVRFPQPKNSAPAVNVLRDREIRTRHVNDSSNSNSSNSSSSPASGNVGITTATSNVGGVAAAAAASGTISSTQYASKSFNSSIYLPLSSSASSLGTNSSASSSLSSVVAPAIAGTVALQQTQQASMAASSFPTLTTAGATGGVGVGVAAGSISVLNAAAATSTIAATAMSLLQRQTAGYAAGDLGTKDDLSSEMARTLMNTLEARNQSPIMGSYGRLQSPGGIGYGLGASVAAGGSGAATGAVGGKQPASPEVRLRTLPSAPLPSSFTGEYYSSHAAHHHLHHHHHHHQQQQHQQHQQQFGNSGAVPSILTNSSVSLSMPALSSSSTSSSSSSSTTNPTGAEDLRHAGSSIPVPKSRHRRPPSTVIALGPPAAASESIRERGPGDISDHAPMVGQTSQIEMQKLAQRADAEDGDAVIHSLSIASKPPSSFLAAPSAQIPFQSSFVEAKYMATASRNSHAIDIVKNSSSSSSGSSSKMSNTSHPDGSSSRVSTKGSSASESPSSSSSSDYRLDVEREKTKSYSQKHIHHQHRNRFHAPSHDKKLPPVSTVGSNLSSRVPSDPSPSLMNFSFSSDSGKYGKESAQEETDDDDRVEKERNRPLSRDGSKSASTELDDAASRILSSSAASSRSSLATSSQNSTIPSTLTSPATPKRWCGDGEKKALTTIALKTSGLDDEATVLDHDEALHDEYAGMRRTNKDGFDSLEGPVSSVGSRSKHSSIDSLSLDMADAYDSVDDVEESDVTDDHREEEANDHTDMPTSSSSYRLSHSDPCQGTLQPSDLPAIQPSMNSYSSSAAGLSLLDPASLQQPVWYMESYRGGNIGLENAINSYTRSHAGVDRVWIGMLGGVSTEGIPSDVVQEIQTTFRSHSCLPVFVCDKDSQGHYQQFCKQVIWPMFHYVMPDYLKSMNWFPNESNQDSFQSYRVVNEMFAQVIVDNYRTDDIIWVNDYHLMLVPALVRRKIPNAKIGFFLHIPFPSSEIFRCLYARKEVLQGILGASMIGFQTYSFARHFLQTCSRILGHEVNPTSVKCPERDVKVGIFPIGIDFERLDFIRQQPEVYATLSFLKEKYAGKKIIFGRDKLDFVKGVRQKLLAFEKFLDMYPEWIGKVVLIQVALSTTEQNESQGQVADVVSQINSKHGTLDFMPVIFLHQDIPFTQYLALMTAADCCLITSLRDGFNLTSHEYIVCQTEQHHPLILSEFAGTYGSFGAAIRVNPWNYFEVAKALNDALCMSEEDRKAKHGELLQYVKTRTAKYWVESFISELEKTYRLRQVVKNELAHIGDFPIQEEFQRTSGLRLIVMDYSEIFHQDAASTRDMQPPSAELLGFLEKLTRQRNTKVCIVSSFGKEMMQDWFGGLDQALLGAENGCIIRIPGSDIWKSVFPDIDLSWRDEVTNIMESFTQRTPGSYVERNQIGIRWHFDIADLNFGHWQAKEVQSHILSTTKETHPFLEVHMAKKHVEVRPRSVNKGIFAKYLLGQNPNYSLLLAIGSNPDSTDMFEAIGAMCSDSAKALEASKKMPSTEIGASTITNISDHAPAASHAVVAATSTSPTTPSSSPSRLWSLPSPTSSAFRERTRAESSGGHNKRHFFICAVGSSKQASAEHCFASSLSDLVQAIGLDR